MAVERGRCARAAREARAPGRRPRRRTPSESWSPDRHRMISGEEVLELLPGAGRRASRPRGYLFYDCQTDDVAPRADRARRGRALRRGAAPTARGRPGCSRATAAPAACGCATPRAASAFDVRAANVVNATGVWADQLRPQELHDEAELPRIRPSRGTHITLAHDDLPLRRRARSCRPAAGARSSRCRGSGTRWSARPTTTTRARSSTSSRSARRRRLPARCRQRVLRHRARAATT